MGNPSQQGECGSSDLSVGAPPGVVMERMLAGVATRRHARVAEPVGQQPTKAARSTSKSTVSRRFVKQTQTASAELMARDLAQVDVKVLMLDGEHLAHRCVVVAMAITGDGTKVPVGLWDGPSENKTVVTALLADLVARGLAFEDGLLVVLDGAKALTAGVRQVFGNKAAVQRCTLHYAEGRIMPSWPPKGLGGKGFALLKSA
jgi:putative transposase